MKQVNSTSIQYKYTKIHVCLLVFQLCLCNSVDYSPPGSYVHGDSPGMNAEVGSHSLLQGIFPTQGSNPGLLHCRRILYCLNHPGSPANIYVCVCVCVCVCVYTHTHIHMHVHMHIYMEVPTKFRVMS